MSDNRNYFSKKYFIFKFKNYIENDNKILATQYTPCIREILQDYISIHEDINNSRELEKLSYARKGIIEALHFFIKNSILLEDNRYKFELAKLIQQTEGIESLKEEQKSLRFVRLYNSAKSLIKKYEKINFYSYIVEYAKNSSKYIQIKPKYLYIGY